MHTVIRLFPRALLLILAAAAALLAAPAAHAQDKVLKVGTLKLIHGISAYFYERFVPAGYKVEVIPFESPTDGKNAVLTGTVDTCIHGIAAFILGAAAGEPVTIVANANNGGMAVMAGVNTDIKSIKDLKGKKVAIWPGSTQEAVILERLRMEGMTIRDIQPIRLQFSDHAAALARGDVDAYVGAEPAAGISLANGTGRLVEYPYSTPIGPLNMILSASQKAVKENPERIRLVVDMHRKAVDYAMAHQARDRRHGDTEARPAEAFGGARGAERRAGVEARRRIHGAGQGVHAADAREQADPPDDRPGPVRQQAVPVMPAVSRGPS